MVMNMYNVPLSWVTILQGRAPLNEKNVIRIMDSIKTMGLFTPIFVTSEYVLVSGAHRLEAMNRLHALEVIEHEKVADKEGKQFDYLQTEAEKSAFEWTKPEYLFSEIGVVQTDEKDESKLKIMEIEENMARNAKYTPVELCKMAWEGKQSWIAQGLFNDGHKQKAQAGKLRMQDLADLTKVSKSSIKNYVRIWNDFSAEVREFVMENREKYSMSDLSELASFYKHEDNKNLTEEEKIKKATNFKASGKTATDSDDDDTSGKSEEASKKIDFLEKENATLKEHNAILQAQLDAFANKKVNINKVVKLVHPDMFTDALKENYPNLLAQLEEVTAYMNSFKPAPINEGTPQ